MSLGDFLVITEERRVAGKRRPGLRHSVGTDVSATQPIPSSTVSMCHQAHLSTISPAWLAASLLPSNKPESMHRGCQKLMHGFYATVESSSIL